MKKQLYFLAIALSISISGVSQGYYVSEHDNWEPVYSGFYDRVWHNVGDESYLSDWVSLPFIWEFYGTPVTQFKLSENGYLIFGPTTEIYSDGANTNLSDPSAPDNAIFAFWDNFVAPINNGGPVLLTNIRGNEGSRIFYIEWLWTSVNGANGDISFELALYEGCGDFDITVGTYGPSDVSVPLTGTIGCKKNGTEYTQVSGSPVLDGNVDGRTYQFHYDNLIERDLSLDRVRLPNHIVPNVSHEIFAIVRNAGVENVTSFNLNYSIDGGTPFVHQETGVSIEPGKAHVFTHDNSFYIDTIGDMKEVEFWVDNINGVNDQRSCNDRVITKVVGIENNQNSDKKVVIEKFTYPACGYCIDGSVVVDEIVQEHGDRVIPISCHNSDFLETEASENVIANFSSNGFPNGVVDRVKRWGDNWFPLWHLNSIESMGRGQWATAVEEQLESFSPADVQIATDYDQSTQDVNVEVKIKYTDYSAGDGYGIVLAILENERVGHQANSYSGVSGHPYGSSPSWITDFIHKHTLSEYIDSDCYGVQGLIPDFNEPGDEIAHTFSFVLDNGYDPGNISLVAFLTKKTPTNQSGMKGMIGQEVILNAEISPLIGGPQIGLEEIPTSTIRLYPNPAQDFVFIASDLNENQLDAAIFDVSGKYIGEYQNVTDKLDIRHLNSGVYFIVLTDNKGENTTLRFVKK